MPKRLRYSQIRILERTGALMLVEFLDDEGNFYTWAPKWDDMRKIYEHAINVERFNKPESRFLNQFAKTVANVVEQAQRLESAWKVRGRFERYQDGQLVILDGGYTHVVTPAFEMTVDFLDHWLERHVEAFVLNGLCIRLGHVDDYGFIEDYYPPEASDD